jgi:hypothetical protein
MGGLLPPAGRSEHLAAVRGNPSAGEGPAIHVFDVMRSRNGVDARDE